MVALPSSGYSTLICPNCKSQLTSMKYQPCSYDYECQECKTIYKDIHEILKLYEVHNLIHISGE